MNRDRTVRCMKSQLIAWPVGSRGSMDKRWNPLAWWTGYHLQTSAALASLRPIRIRVYWGFEQSLNHKEHFKANLPMSIRWLKHCQGWPISIDQTTQKSLFECRSNQTPTRWVITRRAAFRLEIHPFNFSSSCRFKHWKARNWYWCCAKLSMVFCGKPSKGCAECRRRRIKVCAGRLSS